MDFLLQYSEFISEARADQTTESFAAARLAGATKIAEAAKEKGGPAMLTYHHFVVKLPYYKKAADGKLRYNSIESEYKKLLGELTTQKHDQTQFQKLVGKIEVLGELMIKHNEIS